MLVKKKSATILKVAIVLLTISHSFARAPVRKIQQRHDNCEVYVIDRRTQRKVMSKEFSTVIGEEELTTRTYSLPGTKLIITASVFYTDESMASKSGADSMQLGIAVGERALKDAFDSIDVSIAEVTLNTLDTARTEKRFRSGKTSLVIGLICSSGKN